MPDDLRCKLISLGAERLADTLLELREQSDSTWDAVERLTSAKGQLSSGCRAAINGLRRMKRYYDWKETKQLAGKLQKILADMQASVDDPRQGLDLICAFLETDENVLECCDDSNGTIGDIYRYDANHLFCEYAGSCTDKPYLLERIKELLKTDPYDLRGLILDEADKYLPAEDIRGLCNELQQSLEQTGRDEFSQYRFALLTLAGVLKDPELYIQTELAGQDCPPQSHQMISFAREYQRAGDPRKALEWLEQVNGMPDWRWAEKAGLEIELLRELGEMDRARQVAFELFSKHICLTNLELLLEIAGTDQREPLLKEATKSILSDRRFDIQHAKLLRDTGLAADLEQYIVQTAKTIDGNQYHWLAPLAEHLLHRDQHLAATLVFRPLLESVLDRGFTKAYHHAARYLLLLNELAGKISDWRGQTDHPEFRKRIEDQHKRKYRFWQEVGDLEQAGGPSR